jgi:hypothetical protein
MTRFGGFKTEFPNVAQAAKLDELCELHGGTVQINMTRHNTPVGLLMHITGADGVRLTVDEEGRLL